MTVYGITEYGTDVYGLSLPPAYLAIPFQAIPVNYSAILVNWKQPSGIIFRWRLLSNRYGYPVNENDGNIIFDSLTYPGNNYYDVGVVPGTYHYYAMYVLADIGDNLWVRSGVTSCLMPANFQSSKWFYDHTPEYFRTNPVDGSALTDDAKGDTDLVNFHNVLGWGFDYLRTQYNVLYNHLNDPKYIPLDDLWNMAGEVGLTFSPETPAAVVRKAVGNWAHISQERGTLHGLSGELTLRTGWPADVQIGRNMVLEDDQAQFLDPIFLEYTPSQVFHVNECCHFDGCWFRCLIEGTYNIAPAGSRTSNANWHFINDEDDTFNTLLNTQTNNPSTWEPLDSNATNGIPSGTTVLTQGIGVIDPLNSSNSNTNSLRIYNRAGSPKSLWCRSVSRRNIELGNIPDPGFETGVTIEGDQLCRRAFIPGNWPVLGERFKTSIPAFWTPTNCQIVRSQAEEHGGMWSAQISATDAEVAEQTGELADPGFETSAAGWVATNCVVNQSLDQAHAGVASMKITPANVPSPYVVSPQVDCVSGVSNTASVWLFMPATPVSLRVDLHFFDENGNNVGSTNGAASTPTVSTWTNYTVTGTAPATAVTMSVFVTYNGTPAVTNIVYADTVAFSTPASVFGAANAQSPWFTCPAGTGVTGEAWLFSANTLSTNCQVALQWFDQNGTQVGSLATGSAASLTNLTWTQYTCSGTAPDGTAYGALVVILVNAEATDVLYMDDVGVVAGLTQAATFPPEQIQAIQDGIPVPFVRDSQLWDATVRYGTNATVLYEGRPFLALRASTGAVPPVNNIATPEWAPLSQNRRIRLMTSGYMSQNISNGANDTTQVIPFVEWFDKHGVFIARVFSRNPNSGGGVVAVPDSLTFDSFTGLSIVAGTAGSVVTVPTWNASFYNNTTLSGTPAATRIDTSVSFSWSGAPNAGVATSGWSASWLGSFTAPTTGSYTFTITQAGGGSRLFVNGTEVVNNWTTGATGGQSGSVTISAGTVVNLEIDYFETAVVGGGSYGANLLASWSPGTLSTSGHTVSDVSPVVAVAANVGYKLAVKFETEESEGEPEFDVTIAWLDALGGTIGTATSGLVPASFTGTTNVNLTGTTPGGVSSAQVTCSASVSGFGGYGGFVESFVTVSLETQTPTAGTGSLSLGTITAPTSVTGLVVTSSLAGRRTDDEQSSWTVPTGAFVCGGYEGGTTWPTDPTVRSVALLTGAANANIGVTFRSAPATITNHQGIVFRYTNDSNYWQANRTQLRKKVAGVWSTVGTYSTAFADNDRMVVQANGSAIMVFRNGGNQVLSVTDSFNSTATSHGIEVE